MSVSVAVLEVRVGLQRRSRQDRTHTVVGWGHDSEAIFTATCHEGNLYFTMWDNTPTFIKATQPMHRRRVTSKTVNAAITKAMKG
jgi:hypothetical protein